MADIQLQKVNEVYIKVTAEPGVEREIFEYFKYQMPNYQYSPKGRKGWNGWVYLYNIGTKRLCTGLLKYLLEWAREHKYSVEYNPDLFIYNDFSLTEGQDYLNSLKLPVEPREYQVIGFTKAIRYKRLTMISPTRSGKSLVIYSFSRFLLEYRQCHRGVLIVPTTTLVEQMYGDFQEYSAQNLWSVEDRVQRLYSGYTKDILPNTQLLVCTWQTLKELPDKVLADFDFIIGDEAHTFSAKEVGRCAGRCISAAYRLATTGTTHEDNISNLKVEGYFGPISKLTTTKKLMDDGHIATLSVKSLVLKYPEGTQMLVDASASGPSAAAAYQAELDYIIHSVPRNLFIRNLALSIEGNSLLMFHYERHGIILHDLIKDRIDESTRKLFFVNGKTETEVRDEVRKIANLERNSIIVGSSVFSTGITIPNLNNVIFATPTKAKIRTLQSIGRSLGLGDNKTTATLYDIADDFTEGKFSKPNYTLQHYAKRMKLYADEKFTISHYTIKLRKRDE
jgi:superfamily II DNA or RNA helicase